jgi:hypothetical protein
VGETKEFGAYTNLVTSECVTHVLKSSLSVLFAFCGVCVFVWSQVQANEKKRRRAPSEMTMTLLALLRESQCSCTELQISDRSPAPAVHNMLIER